MKSLGLLCLWWRRYRSKKRNLKIIALIGKSGGLLKDLADISIVVKSDITSHIQESHIALLHCICESEAN